jgi:hypothetical protein
MASFPFKVMQHFEVVREIDITVDGVSLEDAREQLNSGSVDIPSFDDPNWKSSWRLQSECCLQPDNLLDSATLLFSRDQQDCRVILLEQALEARARKKS